MYFNSKQKKRFNSAGAKSSVSWIIVFVLMSFVFASMGFAGTIQGFKFYDMDGDGAFDDGEPLFPDHVYYVRNFDTLQTDTLRIDATGNYSVTGLAAGNYLIWSPNYDGWTQTSPTSGSGSISYPVKVETATTTKTVLFGITDRVPPLPPPPLACAQPPTISSVSSGNWDDSATWNPARVPASGDWVSIGEGHIITVPNYIDLGNGGLCNRGKIKSGANKLGNPVTKVEIHALSIDNEGIIGKESNSDTSMDGAIVNGHCWSNATAGSSIELWATLVVNGVAGKIQAGNGGLNGWSLSAIKRDIVLLMAVKEVKQKYFQQQP